MKKKYLVGLAAGVFMLGMAGMASATSYSDTYNPSDIYLSAGNDLSWTFDITHDLGASHSGTYGFNPVTMDVTWASITLWLADDMYDWYPSYDEWAQFVSEGTASTTWEVNTGTATFNLTSLLP